MVSYDYRLAEQCVEAIEFFPPIENVLFSWLCVSAITMSFVIHRLKQTHFQADISMWLCKKKKSFFFPRKEAIRLSSGVEKRGKIRRIDAVHINSHFSFFGSKAKRQIRDMKNKKKVVIVTKKASFFSTKFFFPSSGREGGRHHFFMYLVCC